MIRQECKKIVKPMINEVLAEQFLKVITENKSSEMSLAKFNQSPDQEEELDSRENFRLKQIQEQHQKKLAKLAGNDPMQQLIYEDINPEEASQTTRLTNVPEGFHIDSDDDGVDLSRLGW